mmetsp:Transcript_15078/g.24398  ORF Transcript_15078/g.24398 Transcript_15078/m.24398 type:complete len:329 (-) Transcript_15078:363-1349(-)
MNAVMPAAFQQEIHRVWPRQRNLGTVSAVIDLRLKHPAWDFRIGSFQGQDFVAQQCEGIYIRLEVVGHASSNVRTHVSRRSHLSRHSEQGVMCLLFVLVTSTRIRYHSRKVKVENLQCTFRIKADVIGLQVPVDDPFGMQVAHGFGQLPNNVQSFLRLGTFDGAPARRTEAEFQATPSCGLAGLLLGCFFGDLPFRDAVLQGEFQSIHDQKEGIVSSRGVVFSIGSRPRTNADNVLVIQGRQYQSFSHDPHGTIGEQSRVVQEFRLKHFDHHLARVHCEWYLRFLRVLCWFLNVLLDRKHGREGTLSETRSQFKLIQGHNGSLHLFQR